MNPDNPTQQEAYATNEQMETHETQRRSHEDEVRIALVSAI
jgi:hypothetical protein